MANKLKDETRKLYGKLVVRCLSERRKGRAAMWVCDCECGNETVVAGTNLRNGHTQSCGCVGAETARIVNIRHGHIKRNRPSKTYSCWLNMRGRCQNPKAKSYLDYGGRGIKVCERWQQFENFLEDMGEAPVWGQIERIDVNGNYEPSNCRWATSAEQSRNKRNSVKLTFVGRAMTVAEWARETGIKDATLRYRLKRGLPLDQVFAEYLNESRVTAACDLHRSRRQ